MLGLGESCSRCKSNGRIVIDRVANKISCYECGLEFGLSIVITEPSNGSSDDFLSLTLGNSQHRGSNPVSISNNITEPSKGSSVDNFLSLNLGNSQHRGSIATTEKMDTCSGSDNENVQNLGFDPLSTATTKPNKASSTIAAMSDRLGLLETVKNQAIEISEKTKCPEERSRNVHFAACVFIACRQNDVAVTIAEISSAADGATVWSINEAIHSIAAKLGLPLDPLMRIIRAAEFTKRFCFTVGMDSRDTRAAQEAAEAYPKFVDCGRPPLSVAAVILYVIARVSFEKRLLKGIMDATGVAENTIKETYKDLYPHLPAITPKWFANANDLKKLGSP